MSYITGKATKGGRLSYISCSHAVPLYDKIGVNYDTTRRADLYLTERLAHHLGLDSGGKIIPTNEGWDLRGNSPDGTYSQIQIKTGTSDSQYYDTLEAIRGSDYTFGLGSELHERIAENAPDLADK